MKTNNLARINLAITQFECALRILEDWKQNDDERKANEEKNSDFMRDVTDDPAGAIRVLEATKVIKLGKAINAYGRKVYQAVIL